MSSSKARTAGGRAAVSRPAAAIAAVAVAVAVVAMVAGCGGGPRRPALSSVPLVAGATVVAHGYSCDVGANAYCALDVVLVNRDYASAARLVAQERRRLKRDGWLRVPAQTGDELAADSPGDRVRVTYTTAALDLKDIDLGWIKRPRAIALALSRAIYAGSAAMSMMLVAGPS
jgi:hypothetical protein